MKKNQMFKNFIAMFLIASVGLLISCSDDDAPSGPIASFQFAVSGTNFLEVTFTNFSQNATSYAWDFGDGNSSTEENPTHTYDATGTYTVTLEASDDAGATASFSADVTITDPDEALTLLAGADQKTWKLVREGVSMLLLSEPGGTVYWPGNSNEDGTRPCLYDDSFTFTRDGKYIYDDGGTFWAEFGVFNNVAGCDTNVTPESCFEATAANMKNACGDDVSAWLSGEHTYEYNASTGKITLNGMGAWIGIPKLGTDKEYITPQASVMFDAVLVDGGESMVDTMYVSFTHEGTFWPITYVSYRDPSKEPAIVSVSADFAYSTSGLEVTFTNQSSGATTYSWDFGDGTSSTEESPVHTYAMAGTYSVTLTASDASGSSNSTTKEVTVSELTLTDPAPTPTEPEANVISIYSDAYTNISGVDTNPNWGQATVVTEETVQGDNVLLLSGLNYQGIDFSGNAQDVSGKTNVHIDVWTALDDVTINFYLISPGPNEIAKSLTLTKGQWASFDIPLTDFSSVVDLTQVFQMKFDDAGSGTAPSFYIDNIYFY